MTKNIASLPIHRMAISLESLREVDVINFRAPPPSPVGAGRQSAVANHDILSDFLEHSLRVPDLVLPDRVFPRQKPIQNPPTLDFQLLDSNENESLTSILGSISQIGCFELINHDISSNLIRSVTKSGAGIFEIAPEKKAAMSRSSERPYGFVEFHGDQEDRESSEEFVWCRDEVVKLEMEGVWPIHYSNFSDKMERLLSEIEKVGEKFISVVEHELKRKWKYEEQDRRKVQQQNGRICYMYKHRHKLEADEKEGDSSLKYEVIRMLIRGSEHGHALCFHICHASSEFHVYSKKGWISFCPDKDALVVTVGDQLQAWSGGEYKHVIGRPMFSSSSEGGEENSSTVSMAFLYSPPNTKMFRVEENYKQHNDIISIRQQVVFVLLVSVVYNFLIYIGRMFG